MCLHTAGFRATGRLPKSTTGTFTASGGPGSGALPRNFRWSPRVGRVVTLNRPIRYTPSATPVAYVTLVTRGDLTRWPKPFHSPAG